MRFKVFILIAIVFLITLLLDIYALEIDKKKEGNPLLMQLVKYPPNDAYPKVVQSEEIITLETIYVTVTDKDPVFNLSFQEMNQLSQPDSISMEPRLPIKLRIESIKKEPDLQNSRSVFHATIEQRGYSARIADLKSYKIRLDADQEQSDLPRIINLNKHPTDYTRVRNKLSYDYFELIPGMIPMNTQFVQLLVMDQTANPPDDTFVDYGLFTQIEQPNKDFLKREALDPDGYLYKATAFEFYRYPEILRDRDDPLYNKEAFEKILSISGREYHEKLLTMLDDVNDESKDFERVFSRYFDKENFLTWVAVNLLMGNLDTTGNNFLLYSSRYSDKWYFLPWDYDKAWNYDWQWGYSGKGIHPAREGLSLYWGWPLAKRFFKNPENVASLSKKMEELSEIMTEEQTKAFLDQYYPIVRPLVLRSPDEVLLPDDAELRFDEEYYSLIKAPKQNLQKYYANLEKPMPIFIAGPWVNGDTMTFTWESSYDLQGNEIYYDIKISETPDFLQIIYEKKGLQVNEWTINKLPTGTYYWQIIIRDSEGYEQVPFESYIDSRANFYHGVKQFSLE